MKKKDIFWPLVIAALFSLIAIPQTREVFIGFTTIHPYIGGFIKFSILATAGELLATRIVSGDWTFPKGAGFRMVIWGFLGMVLVLVFAVFSAGVESAMTKGFLPGAGSVLAFAFLTSTFMNLTFGPVMMIFHRVSDTFIDLKFSAGRKDTKISDAVRQINWEGFFSFVICKTIPFFWIPAHTVTFLLPPEYRVLMAAVLSFALGLILAFAKKKAIPKEPSAEQEKSLIEEASL